MTAAAAERRMGLPDCQPDYSKSYKPISTKFRGGVGYTVPQGQTTFWWRFLSGSLQGSGSDLNLIRPCSVEMRGPDINFPTLMYKNYHEFSVTTVTS